MKAALSLSSHQLLQIIIALVANQGNKMEENDSEIIIRTIKK